MVFILIILLIISYIFIFGIFATILGACIEGYEYIANKFYLKEKKQPKEVLSLEDLALLIYNKCLENDINDFNLEENQEKIEVIASSYNLYSVNQVEELFNEAKSILKERQQEAEFKEMMRYRETEIKNYKQDKKLSHITGKIKYSLKIVLDSVRSYEKISFKEIIYPKELDSITAKRLIDMENISEKLKLIKIGDIKLEKTEGLNIKVNVKIEVKEKIKILNSKAILDGSFKATIYNKDKKKIGEGYFSAPGFGRDSFDPDAKIYVDNNEIYPHASSYRYDFQYSKTEWNSHYDEIRYVGFNHLTDMDFLCYIKSINDLEDDISTYTCQIEPVSLWIIEKLKDEPQHVDFKLRDRWY